MKNLNNLVKGNRNVIVLSAVVLGAAIVGAVVTKTIKDRRNAEHVEADCTVHDSETGEEIPVADSNK